MILMGVPFLLLVPQLVGHTAHLAHDVTEQPCRSWFSAPAVSQGAASCLAPYLRKALEGNWELEMQGDGYPTQVPDPLITGGPATKGGTSFITPPHGWPGYKRRDFVHHPPHPCHHVQSSPCFGSKPCRFRAASVSQIEAFIPSGRALFHPRTA